MEQAYVLRLYDTDLLSFSLSEQGIEGLKRRSTASTKKIGHCSPWTWS